MFDQLLGQPHAKEYLTKALDQDRLPNTLLFSGEEGVGKRTFAEALAARLLQTGLERVLKHPDYHFLSPEGKSAQHSIESIREAMDSSHEAPFEAPAKVFVLESAERMQPAASNALLKTLEEPAPGSYWILLTSSARELLPTILSRCIRLTFLPLSTEQIAHLLQKNGLRSDAAPFARGSMAKAIEIAQSPELSEARQELFSLFSSPPYHKLQQTLEKFDQLIDRDDPIAKSRRADYLFTSIALYCRDQQLRAIDPSSPHLFFPGAPAHKPREDWQKALAAATLGFERNLKLSTCLESFFEIIT